MTTHHDEPIVIVIDDDQDHAALMSRTLEIGAQKRIVEIDPNVLVFHTPLEAIAAFPADRLVVTLLDYQLADGTALDWLNPFTKQNAGPVIILTSQGSEHIAVNALSHGASDYLIKTMVAGDPELLYQAINHAVRRFRLAS